MQYVLNIPTVMDSIKFLLNIVTIFCPTVLILLSSSFVAFQFFFFLDLFTQFNFMRKMR